MRRRAPAEERIPNACHPARVVVRVRLAFRCRPGNTRSGNAHYLASDEDDAIDYVRALLSYLPSNNLDDPSIFESLADLSVSTSDLALDTVIPDSANRLVTLPE